MNRNCEGHVFYVHGDAYYRCLYDGRTSAVVPSSGKKCPLCERIAAPEEAEVANVRTFVTVDLGSIGHVQLILEDSEYYTP